MSMHKIETQNTRNKIIEMIIDRLGSQHIDTNLFRCIIKTEYGIDLDQTDTEVSNMVRRLVEVILLIND